MTGSDFTHADAATEPQFAPYLRQRAARGEISDTLVRKITQDNPIAFYGL